MSLNGLDGADIREAHQAAAGQPGGWFLLRYASRDEIALLGRGVGGIVEARNAIAAYEEISPLFGFLSYRRRNVILKYLPAECGQLAQARATVHFMAVCEQFAPWNITFEIASAKELKDTKLSAACSPHAASGSSCSSSSSTSSIRRRRMDEIAEEAQEEAEERVAKRRSLEQKQGADADADADTVTLNSDLAADPEEARFSIVDELPTFVGVVDAARSGSAGSSAADPARRMSSQSSRPDLFPHTRQRVKLGPRPSVDAGRPRTSQGAAAARPVSQLPSGFKLLSSRTRRAGSREANILETEPSNIPAAEKSLQEELALAEATASIAASSSDTTTTTILPPNISLAPNTEPPEITFAAINIPIPGNSDPAALADPSHSMRPHTSSGRPSSAVFAIRPSAMSQFGGPSARGSAMTPEKARLMKAMQLREMKKKREEEDAAAGSRGPHPSPDEAAPGPADDVLAGADEPGRARPRSFAGADPADVPAHDHISDAAADSRPTSPVMALSILAASEPDQSTKASSLSDSADGTAHARSDNEEEEEGPTERADKEFADNKGTTGITHSPETLLQHLPVGPPEPETSGIPAGRPSIPPAGTTELAATEICKNEICKNEVSKNEDGEEEEEDRADRSEETTPRLSVPSSALTLPTPAGRHQQLRPATAPAPLVLRTDDRSLAATTVHAGNSRDSGHTARRPGSSASTTDRPVSQSDFDARSLAETAFDDELLIDELQIATVQQAMPITVAAKTAVMAPPPPGGGGSQVGSPHQPIRTVSNPVRGSMLSPPDVTQSSARSLSTGAAYVHKIAQQRPSSPGAGLAVKKGKVGSGILSRLQAFENLNGSSGSAGSGSGSGGGTGSGGTASSGGGISPPADLSSRPTPSSAFYAVGKTARALLPQRTGSIHDRAQNMGLARPPHSGSAGAHSPDHHSSSTPPEPRLSRDRSGSVASRLSMFESPPGGIGGIGSGGRPESIQVTARIIRDPNQPLEPPLPSRDPSEFAHLELRQSPLVVDHLRSIPGPAGLAAAIDLQACLSADVIQKRRSVSSRPISKEDRDRDRTGSEAADLPKSRRSSLGIVKSFMKGGGKGKNLTSPSVEVLSPPPLHGGGSHGSPGNPGTPSRSPSRPPSTHYSGRLSVSSRRSSTTSKEPATPAGALSPTSTEAGASGDERSSSAGGDKKSRSRTRNFIRRLSSSLSVGAGGGGGGSSRTKTPTGISPTVHEEEFVSDALGIMPDGGPATPGPGPALTSSSPLVTAAPTGPTFPPGSALPQAAAAQNPTITAYMGDVNVQFPDTLLWKRRSMCLDSQGFLILSALPGSNKGGAAAAKRFHLSDFRLPFVPDVEAQELPNSVVLEFVESSGLQIACEDRSGQLSVLHTLQDAHKVHVQ